MTTKVKMKEFQSNPEGLHSETLPHGAIAVKALWPFGYRCCGSRWRSAIAKRSSVDGCQHTSNWSNFGTYCGCCRVRLRVPYYD